MASPGCRPRREVAIYYLRCILGQILIEGGTANGQAPTNWDYVDKAIQITRTAKLDTVAHGESQALLRVKTM